MYMSSQGRELIAARGKNEQWGAWVGWYLKTDFLNIGMHYFH